MFLVGNQREHIILNLSHYILLSCIEIKLSEYRMGIKFDKDSLNVKQSNYASQIINIYIVYDLDAWPKILLRNFPIKNC